MNSTTTTSQRANPEEAKRNLASISPFFTAKDLQTSISHYIESFGFKLDFKGPPEDVSYGHVSRVAIGIMLKAILTDGLAGPNHTRHARHRCQWEASRCGCRRFSPLALWAGVRAWRGGDGLASTPLAPGGESPGA